MSITRPRGEQIVFSSVKTGEHSLDTYLESAERGTRTISELFDEIVDSSGDLRTNIFEFRETPAVNGVSSGILQARVGTFLDTTSGWANITSTNFATFVTAAQLAKTQAESAKASADADVVLTNADVVLTHADVVLTHADAILAEADKVQTALDRIATGNDKTATNADVVLTNADVVLTHADVVLAEADKVQTALDRIATAADVVLTNADVVLAEADKVQTGLDRTAAANSATASANSATASANSATASANSVSGAAGSASTATTKAAEASASASNAAASLASFTGQYVAQSSAPSSADSGDLWFDTSAGIMKVYNGSGWVSAGSSVNGVVNSVQHTATAGQTTFTATYDAGYVQVFLNGIRLDAEDYTASNGSTVVLDIGATVNDVVFINSFGTFLLSDHYSKVAADARYAQKSNNLSDLASAATARTNLGLDALLDDIETLALTGI